MSLMVQQLGRASLEAGGIIAVIGLVTTLWPGLRASWRTLLWWCGGARLLLGLITFPALKLSFTPTAISGPLRSAGAHSFISTRALSAFDALQAAPVAYSAAWASWLFGLWAIGVAAGLGWTALQLLRQRRVLAASSAADKSVERLALEVARAIEVERVPELRVSTAIASPQLTGFVRPRIILPERFAKNATDAELRLAICHELVHLQRHDLWLGLVPMVARVVFWFHPLAWWAAREYAQAREEATDARVLEVSHASAASYGQLLLAFMTTSSSAAFVAARAGSSHFESMKKRLENLQMSHASNDKLWGYVAVVTFVALGLVPLQLRADPMVATRREHPVAPVPPAPPVAPRAVLPEPIAPVAPTPLPAGVGYVVFTDDDDSATMAGTMDDMRLAQSLRKDGKRLLFVRQNGDRYVIRDAAFIARIRSAQAPELALVAQQSALADQQAGLGAKQAALSEKNATIGEKLTQLAEHAARTQTTPADAAGADQERQMKKLDEQQEALGREQEKLGSRQEALGRQQEQASAELEATLWTIVDEAVANGKAVKF